MADATPLIPGLLDDIVIWEILVCLPPKALLRCRAVRRAWRRTTSTRGFLLAHHAHQPTLLIASGYYYRGNKDIVRQDILAFDRLATADAQLQHVAKLDERDYQLVASCDGLLLFSYNKYGWEGSFFSIFNPATRQYASLSLFAISRSWKFDDFEDVPTQVLGMYQHGPTGEYRILLYAKILEIDDLDEETDEEIDDHDEETDDLDDVCHIFALGSIQPSRNIGCPPEAEQVLLYGGAMTAVLFHGNLHWYIHQTETESNMIVVFDTTTESFRQMHVPAVPVASNGFAYTDLFDLHGVLGMFSCDEASSNINISVLQDYESDVWTFKCKIELPVTEFEMLCGELDDSLFVVVMAGDGELIVLVQFHERLLQIDMDGKLVATFHGDGVGLTKMQLKQTLVQHTFFPTLE